MIILDKDHRLDADSHQFIIQKRSIVQETKSKNYNNEVWTNEGYFAKVEDVLDYMMSYNIRENISSIENIMNAIIETRDMFSELLKAKRD